MLAMLHKVVIGCAHPAFSSMFPPAPNPSHTHLTRLRERRHNKQLLDRCDGTQSSVMHRSVFGLVRRYSLLPQLVVDADNVSLFQKRLTQLVREELTKKNAEWQYVLC